MSCEDMKHNITDENVTSNITHMTHHITDENVTCNITHHITHHITHNLCVTLCILPMPCEERCCLRSEVVANVFSQN